MKKSSWEVDMVQTPQRRRAYLMETPSHREKLKAERAESLSALGLVSLPIDGGKRVVIPLRDCVRFPDGTLMPKIEFVMDQLGPTYVSAKLREAGFSFRSSKGLEGYRDFLDKLVRECAETKI